MKGINLIFPGKNDILALGKGWLAVEKPAGISVHNEPGMDICSFFRQFLQKNPVPAEEIAYSPDFGIHPVHRLDKETGGVLLLAAEKESLRNFSRQFTQRTVSKKYLAIVHGEIKAEETQVWNFPLSAGTGGRKNPAGKGRKYPAQTQFRLLRKTPHYSLIECSLLTGRRHQIRRHAKLAGHPVIGDRRYASPRSLRFLETICSFRGMGLHAMSLTLIPPGEKAPLEICSAGFPREMELLLENDKLLPRKK